MTTPASTSSHAVVIGGSLAGLLAGRVLADHFDRVTILERDRYPDTPVARAGVPQSPHVHALLARGLAILEHYLPGARAELVAAGAVELHAGSDLAWLLPAGWGVPCASDITFLAFTRPLLDALVRRRVAALPNVAILESTDVAGLVAGADGRRVTGVATRRRGAAYAGCVNATVAADLVVDASGRGSRAPEWLEALGYPVPEEIVVDAKIGYASRFYRAASGPRDWKAAFVQAAPPERTRAGLLFPVEGARWLVTIVGGGGDFPSTEPEEFEAFLGTLASPIIRDAVAGAEPLSAPAGHRNTANRLRRYDRLTHRPEGFVVVGDAACAFNPVYGQGMTVAAMEAEALDRCLVERRGVDRGFARAYQRHIASIVATPWAMATSEDCRYRAVTGVRLGLAARLQQAYAAHVMRLTTTDPSVRARWIEVFNMLRPPTDLFRPWIVARVVRAAIRAALRPYSVAALPAPRGTNCGTFGPLAERGR